VIEENKIKKKDKLRLIGNSGELEHLINKRLHMPANPTQIGFDATLRKFTHFENTHGPSAEWKTLAMSPKKTLLDKYLPPLKPSSLYNLSKLKTHVCKPLEFKYNVK
jgi:hypothetical protein